MNAKDQSELQAIHKDPPTHNRIWVHFLLSTGMKDRNGVLDLDMLLKYDLDDLCLLTFAAGGVNVELNLSPGPMRCNNLHI